MVPFLQTFQAVLRSLDSKQIRYMIVGSLASSVYGEPRLTRDMDLLVAAQTKDSYLFLELFKQPEFYCPPIEVIQDEIANARQFNLLHVATGLKVDIMIQKPNAYDNERFQRRKKMELWPNFEAFLASPEDIIIKKLEYFRDGQSEKHLRDIRGILGQTPVDESYINLWVQKFHLENEWKKI